MQTISTRICREKLQKPAHFYEFLSISHDSTLSSYFTTLAK